MAVNVEGVVIVLAVFLLIMEIRCQQNCPVDCVTCINAHNCSTCVSGKYGPKCESDCIVLCSDNTCDQNTGTCNNTCLADQYLYSNQLCKQCPQRCSSCTNSTNCTSCKQWYNWGSSCQYDCNYCLYSGCRKHDGCYGGCGDNLYRIYNYYKKGFECVRCQEHCRTCSNATECLTCETGYWGSQCQYNCSACKSFCSKHEGCIGDCITGYYRNQIDSEFQCVECPETCTTCKNATACLTCENRYWGSYCQHNCTGCNGHCDEKTGCVSNCSTGHYLRQIDNGFQCEKCLDGRCLACTTAIDCKECMIGYYPANAKQCVMCPEHCKSFGYCSNRNGSCTDGCTDGWTGNYCDKKCPANCLQCEQFNSSYCDSCSFGFYGDSCYSTCSSNCKHINWTQACDKRHGTCRYGCKNGYWGDKCTIKCSRGCFGNICNQSTGVCVSGCKENFCGRHCNEEQTPTSTGITVGTQNTKQESSRSNMVVVALSVVTGIAVVVAAVSTFAVIFLLKRGRSLRKETKETADSNLSHELELENHGYEELHRTGSTDGPYGTVQSEYENA